MKIAWFTPFSKGSAIGRFSQAVTAELAKTADVDIWTGSAADSLPTDLRVLEFNPSLPMQHWWPEWTYDFAVCNLGDHLGNHQRIFEFSRKVPSIIILHDFVMQHFFAGYYQLVVKDLDAHLRRIEFLYGDRGRKANERALKGEAHWIWETREVVEFPMFEDCVSGALGVVTHSRFFREHVESVYPGLVQDIALAYTVHPNAVAMSRSELGVPADRVLAITVGNVNGNKRIPEVIEALGAMPDIAKRIRYIVCGSISDGMRTQLEDRVSELSLRDAVHIHGAATDEELHSLLSRADFCINLRNPAMEGGSASLAESMLYGKAVIVSDTGVYAETPDECVMKVRPDHEAADLRAAITKLVGDVPFRRNVGARAREYADRNFSPANYATRFLQFLDDVSGRKPVLDVVYRVSRVLDDLNVPADMEIVRTVSKASAELFCGPTDAAPFHRK